MAVTLTASASVAPSPVVTGMPTWVTVTVTNSGTTPTFVTGLALQIVGTSGSTYENNMALSIAPLNFGPNAPNLAVGPTGAGNASIYFVSQIVVHAPSTGTLSTGTNTYTLAGAVYAADGSVTSISSTTFTVNYAVSYPASQS